MSRARRPRTRLGRAAVMTHGGTPQSVLAGVVLVVLLAGCAQVLYTDIRYSAGVPIGEKTAVDVMQGHDKAWVLEQLGPPDNVLPRVGGDTFIYLNRSVNFDMINLNTGAVSPAPISVYVDSQGQRRVRRLTIYFDEAGRVRDVAFPTGRVFQ